MMHSGCDFKYVIPQLHFSRPTSTTLRSQRAVASE
jgi:hypothetical protein